MELKPTDLILRRRTDLGFTRDRHIKYASRLEPTCGAPSRRMAAGSVSLVAVLRDARNPSRRAPQVGHARLRMTCALLRTRLSRTAGIRSPGELYACRGSFMPRIA